MLLAGRIVSIVGGAGVLLASFLTWFWGAGEFPLEENGWQGAESVAAVVCMLLAIGLLAAVWISGRGWLALGIVQLVLCVLSSGLTLYFILYNSEPVIVSGRHIPTGIGAGAWLALGSSVVMIVGGILNLASGGPLREAEVDYDEEEDDYDRPPRRRRRPREHDDRDDWDETPRRRRRPPPQSRRPRRREMEED